MKDGAWESKVKGVSWLTRRKQHRHSISSHSAELWAALSYVSLDKRKCAVILLSIKKKKKIIKAHLCKSSNIVSWKLKPSAWNAWRSPKTSVSSTSTLPTSPQPPSLHRWGVYVWCLLFPQSYPLLLHRDHLPALAQMIEVRLTHGMPAVQAVLPLGDLKQCSWTCMADWDARLPNTSSDLFVHE